MVAIWRSPELEGVFGGPLDATGLTEAALARMVEDSVRESEILDFKAKPHLAETKAGDEPDAKGSRWSSQQEFAKDVCAFANHRGGLLLIGVTEASGGVATGLSATVLAPEAVERRLRLALSNYAAPVPPLAFVSIPVTATSDAETQDRFCIAVVVPPSAAAPHAVSSGTGDERRALHYPVREGADTRWMREYEVAERYRRRSTANREAENLVAETVNNGLAGIRHSTGTWLYLALVPEATPPTRINAETVRATQEWAREYGFVSPNSRKLDLDGPLLPAPGRMTITEWRPLSASQVDESNPTRQHCELYPDGRVFVASELEVGTTRELSPSVIGDKT